MVYAVGMKTTMQEVLETLPGEGNVRKATAAFWEVRNRFKKTLNRLGFGLYQENGQWFVDLKNVDIASDVQETAAAIRADAEFYKNSVWQDTNEKLNY